MNFEGDTFEEMEIAFGRKELEDNKLGFCKYTESLPYVLKIILTCLAIWGGKTVGNQFRVEKQTASYGKIIANCDGGCVKRIHEYVRKR